MNIGIFGTTGYGGAQLLSLLINHPKVNIKFISSNRYTGKKFSQLYPKYTGAIDLLLKDEKECFKMINDVDLIFLALPHGTSMRYTKKIQQLNENIKIIDFSGDFRLKDVHAYEKWYGFDHILKNQVKNFVYGLPELNRNNIKNAKYIANPGCFTTCIILGLYPLVKDNLIRGKIIADAKTGVSGAGRKEQQSFLLSEMQDSTYAYKTGTHRHSPEVVHILKEFTQNDITLLFSPHIVPSVRGIFSTIYMDVKEGVTEKQINDSFTKYYANEQFIEVTSFIPSTKDVNRSNKVFISFKYDSLTKTLIVYSVIDNLMKGASSQAIQNMNIMYGFDENLGIDCNNYYL